jgi:hypothetical protein
MCWVGEPFAKVADKDIKVYKVVRATHFTNKQGRDEVQAEAWYRGNTVYFPGKRYQLGKPLVRIPTNHFCECYIEEGFHSYSAEKTSMRRSVNDGMLRLDSENRIGFDFYLYKPSILICVIPRGTVYYENENGEIVSEEIITQRILEWDYLMYATKYDISIESTAYAIDH